MNRFEDELGNQSIKIDRLGTFNKELRSRVDYFISLIQNLNLTIANDES